MNVLVAWGCILWSPYTNRTSPPTTPLINGYPQPIAGPDGMQAYWFNAYGFGVRQTVPSGARGAEGRFLYWKGSHTPAFYRGGWPTYAMQSTVTSHGTLAGWDLPVREIMRRGLQTSWLPAWLHVQKDRRLPMVPHWPGFAVNTLLYFVTILGFRRGLRWRKRAAKQLLGFDCGRIADSVMRRAAALSRPGRSEARQDCDVLLANPGCGMLGHRTHGLLDLDPFIDQRRE